MRTRDRDNLRDSILGRVGLWQYGITRCYDMAIGYGGDITPYSSGGGTSTGGFDFPTMGGAFGAGLQGLGALMQGQAQAAGYTTSQHGAEQAAKETKEKAAYEAWRNDVFTRQTLGEQKNMFGALGIEMRGTAVDVLAATAQQRALDQAMTMHNARMEAAGYTKAAEDYGKAASKAEDAGILGAIGGVAQMAGMMFL